MATSGLPFDDIRELLANLPGPDQAAVQAVRDRDAFLTKPPGALGRLEEIAEWLAAWAEVCLYLDPWQVPAFAWDARAATARTAAEVEIILNMVRHRRHNCASCRSVITCEITECYGCFVIGRKRSGLYT